MYSYNESDVEDVKMKEFLGAKDWQVDVLKLNPPAATVYFGWGGVHYVNKSDPHFQSKIGYQTPIEFNTWGETDLIPPNDLNVLASYYFDVYRNGGICPTCDGNGFNTKTLELYNSFNQWIGTLTPEEIASVRPPDKTWGYDSLDRFDITKKRATDGGFYGGCEICGETGEVFTEPDCHLGLYLWLLYPRKDASRFVFIRDITEQDLPDVIKYLQTGKNLMQAAYSNLPHLGGDGGNE